MRGVSSSLDTAIKLALLVVMILIAVLIYYSWVALLNLTSMVGTASVPETADDSELGDTISGFNTILKSILSVFMK